MELQKSTKKVRDYLLTRGYSYEVKTFPTSTRTAMEAAESIGCKLSQIAKSLIFKENTSNCPVLVIVSGANYVDIQKLFKATNIELQKADGKFIKETTGYAIGGIPPIAHLAPLKTFLDQDLKEHEILWAAAGTPNSVFKLKKNDLEKITHGTWVDLAKKL